LAQRVVDFVSKRLPAAARLIPGVKTSATSGLQLGPKTLQPVPAAGFTVVRHRADPLTLVQSPMRLTPEQIQGIRGIAHRLAGAQAQVRVFGSRLDDNARGGDLDLLLELPDPVAEPALLAAQVSTQVSRLMDGRRVDVVLCAPNLRRLPIHEVALAQGQPL
jgi:predicted nucleotidyltransferase